MRSASAGGTIRILSKAPMGSQCRRSPLTIGSARAGNRASEHLIVIRIVENGGGNGRWLHYRGQVRVAIRNLLDACTFAAVSATV